MACPVGVFAGTGALGGRASVDLTGPGATQIRSAACLGSDGARCLGDTWSIFDTKI